MTHSDFQSDRGAFQQLFASSPDPTWIIENNRFVDCNAVAVRTLGYASRDELLNLHPSRLSPPNQPDGNESYAKAESMMAIARQKGVHRFDWTHTKADDTYFDAEVTLATVDIDGRQVIYCTWRDVTERKKFEASLEESSRRFHDLVVSTDGVVWEGDASTFVFNYVSPSGSARLYKKP